MGSVLSLQADEYVRWKSDAWYAMESGTFCVICGGPFDIEGDVHNLSPKDPRYQWLLKCRLLGYSKDLSNHRLASGNAEAVNTSKFDDVFLSERAWFSVAGTGTFRVLDQTRRQDIWYDVLWYGREARGHNSGGALFPLHEACITIGCRAIDYLRLQQEGLEKEPALMILCRLLNMRFSDRRAEMSEQDDLIRLADDRCNDIFDLCSSDRYGPRSVLALTRLEWCGGEYEKFYSDPISIPALGAFVFDILLASARSKDPTLCHLVITREPKGIERLPAELLDMICSYLPTQSVVKLHRTSKSLCLMLSLNNTFWRNSLQSGNLNPHIWDLDTKQIEIRRKKSNIMFSTNGWDWKSAAKLLAMKRWPINGGDTRLSDIPLGLQNRCRIWHTIETALRLDASRLSGRSGMWWY
ncbi:hypothetical protein GQ44DRAFT_799044 [Phaeosphaeriaceae sp. PMI808]|nr:hypothetical protein GQ44DRAFT_799044 [Phaeosphaeriaceae sp. PMI808]